jgi:YidC/Oxa1 family membrane protein insertase
MDRTSRLGLAACFILLIVIQFSLDKLYPPLPPKRAPLTSSTAMTNNAPLPTAQLSGPAGPPMSNAKPSTATAPTLPAITATFTHLENDAMKVTFTSVGAAITDIELKQHRSDNGGSVVLNERSHSNVMQLAGWPGADTANFQSQETAGGLSFTAPLANGVQWQRTYTFGPPEENNSGITGLIRRIFHRISLTVGQKDVKPLVYTIDVADTLTNPSAVDVSLPPYGLSVGRAVPIYLPIKPWEKEPEPSPLNSQFLGSGWLTKTFHLVTVNNFNPSTVPLIGIKTADGKDEFSSKTIDPAPLLWLGVENQFFTTLLTPSDDLPIDHAEFSCFSARDPESGRIVTPNESDIEAAANFGAVTVPAGKAVTLNYSLYAGPKDFNRLDQLGSNQGELMNYGWFEILIVPMLTVLRFWYLLCNNYGVAIILLTLMIKAITWPLQSKANQAGKRMQALAPLLKELQAKHKDQPEKLQTDTFALYKEYGVNPFGGCLPALVQMPVFFSLYFMLQNAVELRGQSFLWVHDLTRPDAVWTSPFALFLPIIGSFHPSLHPLPIMVTALTMVMMRLTPQIGDPTQAKVAQMMPLIFLVFFYNFAAALSLYYVINNCVSIIPIYRNRKKPMPGLKKKIPAKSRDRA